ncbi:lycopene cyclase domain-containing protein [bacterium]|nr:lycopene cyclase domain-containing protein [bacterium]
MPENNVDGKPGSFSYRHGQRRLYLVWWLLGVLIQVIAGLPFCLKKIQWKSLLWTTLVFLVIMTISETIALHWGWWIWNENQIWGVKIGLIPLEEFLLYFLVVPSLVVFQSWFQLLLDKLGVAKR